MSKTIQNLLTLFLVFFVAGVPYATAEHPTKEEKKAIFVFLPGNDLWLLKGNEAELERLYALVEEYHTEITAGAMLVHVDGYCASLTTPKENLTTAFIRANRVKSELILHKDLKETNFITNNYAHAYNNNKDVVVVTLRLPEPPETVMEEAEEKEQSTEIHSRPEPAVKKERDPEPVVEVVPESITSSKPHCFAVRTNLLYDAFLLPTLGVEWHINRNLSVKLDGSLAWWGNEKGKVQKIWVLNPEVRWYLLRDKRFYVGASGNYGKYNIYKYAIGSIVSKDTGYQGSMWGAGVSVGYQLHLSRRFSADFNLGLGYTRFNYDTFRMIHGVRIYKDRDCSRNFWGPTQAGVNLIWIIGEYK